MDFSTYVSTTYYGFKVISPDITPTEFPDTWVLPGLYNISQTGGISYWQIGFDGHDLISVHGYYTTSTGNEGKLQTDRLHIYQNLSNKDLQHQAYQQAKKKYIDKTREGYTTSPTGVIITQNLTEEINSLPKAQLAESYPMDPNVKSPLNDQHFKRGVTIQPKLDGIRTRIFNVGGEIRLLSRNNKEFSWLDQIRVETKELLKLLPVGVGIDAELYAEGMKFEDITSIIRTEKHKHPRNDEIICYIFDIILLETCLEDRIKILRDAYLSLRNSGYEFKRVFVLIQQVIHDKSEIRKFYDQYVAQGYEGAMLRKLCGGATGKRATEESWYKPRRNNNLLKVKLFMEAEGTVVGYKSGEGRDQGLVIWTIRDDAGNTFDCRPEGSFEIRKYWYDHAQEYLGKRFTYKYFELTEYGIPRFPIGKGFRDYE